MKLIVANFTRVYCEGNTEEIPTVKKFQVPRFTEISEKSQFYFK